MKKTIYFLIIYFGVFSCQSIISTENEKALIIHKSVKSTLKIHQELNSKEYLIDFSKVKYFDRQSINEFLKSNSNFTEIRDSIASNNLKYNKDGYLPKSIIKLIKVEIRGDSIIINIDKIQAIDGACGIEIIFKRTKKIEIVSSKIIWIS
jgi:hypothetical protein